MARPENQKTIRNLSQELRHWEGDYHYPNGLLAKAADHIDQTNATLKMVIADIEKVTASPAPWVGIAAAKQWQEILVRLL